MGRTAFEVFHPFVPTLLFCAIIVLTMFGLELWLTILSLVAALVFSVLTLGVKEALSKLRWQLPLLLLICVINPLFSAMGSTLLARVGPFRIYAESLAYGAVMGALLVATLIWIEALGHIVSSDELMVMSQGILPTATLALSMVLRLVPQLTRRIETSLQVQEANGLQTRASFKTRTRAMSSLLSWALEDSLERADAMRARGWGALEKRSSYMPQSLSSKDLTSLVVIALLACVCVLAEFKLLLSWQFYPKMASSCAWWFHLPFAVLVFVPSALVVAEHISFAKEARR